MEYEELREFLMSKMKLHHIYQPLLIKTLIEVGGTATIRQLATVFLSQDESQIQYYEGRVKEHPMRVLIRHGVITRQGDLVKLTVGKLSFSQKAELKRICEEKLHSYGIERGLAIWDYRSLDELVVPDSLRYRVLKDSNGRCALCGATKNETLLDIDHIIPRSKGGRTVYENLQVLCAKCNRSKRNKDTVDFRKSLLSQFTEGCILCEVRNTSDIILIENDLCLAILDNHAVTRGHTLVFPKRHVTDYFDMSELERSEVNDLLRIRRRQLLESDRSISGFNIGVNCGESAGQTVEHCHIHLIPRRGGDTPNPRGGVRGVVPDKMQYPL